MKKMKKIFALVIACVMMMAMAVPAMAQTVGNAAEGKGSITISNAAKGETYTIYKLFDAKVTGTEGGSIAYTGTVPESLQNYFRADSAGNIHHGKVVDGEFVADTEPVTDLTSDEIAALTAWAETASETAHAESDGSALTFAGIDYGYYVVITTQGETAISVDSTNPNVTIVDKNTTPPVNNPKKYAGEEEAEDAEDTDNNVFIGQQVNYTIEFGTASYDGSGEDAEIITSYIISDDFASGALTNVSVTKIMIGDTEYKVDGEVPQFNKRTITIPWVSGAGTVVDPYKSLYPNGAKIVISYTATVADTAAIDGEGNTNKATITYTTGGQHGSDEYPVEETVYTYAIAIQKVNESDQPLAGATFKFPFYVKETADTDGAYIYAGTTAGTGLVNELTTPADGKIIVKGVADQTYTIEETDPPKGYNKLTNPVKVTAVKTGEKTTSKTIYLDENGNEVDESAETVKHTITVTIDALAATPVVVLNKTGSVLPSTGGIGTTIFYVIGAILVIGAGVVLVTRRRMNVQ